MRTRAPISDARRTETRRIESRRSETRRAEQARGEALRAAQLQASRRRGMRLAAAPGVAIGLILLGAIWGATSFVPGLVVGVIVGVLVAVGAWNLGAPLAVKLTGAAPAGPDQQPRVHNLLDGLCGSAGVAKPRLWVLDCDIPNAMVVATNPARARLVLTSGLLEALARVELEAVLSHELMHLRSGDVLPATVAVASGWALVATVAARDRELAADLAAVALTRYPPALAAVLERMTDRLPVSGIAATLSAHLWFSSPGAPCAPRAAVLREL